MLIAEKACEEIEKKCKKIFSPEKLTAWLKR